MPDILYLPDSAVDAALDLELRELLSTCFTKPQDAVFKERRYFAQPPAHRWMIRSPEGKLVAHIAVHERQIEAGAWVASVGGIAEVCVHPEARGQGLAKLLLDEIHVTLTQRGVFFTALFGSRSIYASSGYTQPGNVSIGPGSDGKWQPVPELMVRPLTAAAWPAGDVRMPGPAF